MSRANSTISHRAAAMGNAGVKTNQPLPRFPPPVVSIRPRGLTKRLLTASAHSSLFSDEARTAGITLGVASKSPGSSHPTIDCERWTNNGRPITSRYIMGRYRLLVPTGAAIPSSGLISNTEGPLGGGAWQSSHELSARLHSPLATSHTRRQGTGVAVHVSGSAVR